MANISFSKTGESTISFGASLLLPISRPQTVMQITDRTAGGTIKVENLGITISRRRLSLTGISSAVYDSLLAWHSGVSYGAKETFTYTDENGNSYTVRWTNDTFDGTEYLVGNKFRIDIDLEIIS